MPEISTLTAAQIAEMVSGELHGNPSAIVRDVSSVAQSRPETLCFLSDVRELKQLEQSSASVVLLPTGCTCAGIKTAIAATITVADPFAAFMQIIPHFRQIRNHVAEGIAPTAIIDPTAQLGSGASVGHYARIGADCQIGPGCRIHSGVSIAEDVVLGRDVIVYPGVVLYAGCRLGDRVIVHANAVLGADGFGYRLQSGEFRKLPHYGRVVLEDDVEIGASTTIDRGLIEDTVIGRGTKIDNQVMIGHNCQVGQHNIIVSQVGLAGSVTTGEYCRFGGQVGIADHVQIGAHSSLVAQAGVFRDIPAGETMGGSPAVPMSEQKKIALATMKLPELRQTVRQLQKQLEQLEARACSPTPGAAEKQAA